MAEVAPNVVQRRRNLSLRRRVDLGGLARVRVYSTDLRIGNFNTTVIVFRLGSTRIQ